MHVLGDLGKIMRRSRKFCQGMGGPEVFVFFNHQHFSQRSIPVFLRKNNYIATCDFPWGGGYGPPVPIPPLDLPMMMSL